MLTMLKDWKGDIEINGEKVDDLSRFKPVSGKIHIKLLPKVKNENLTRNSSLQTHSKESTEYKITVKQYMTRKATPEFDFMAKWNNDNPMPLRIMQGTIEKETRGMIYMKLHGFGERTVTCMCCGKELKNSISRHYGIGPICMGKVGIVADIEDVDTIKEELEKIEWEGWIIKSAITEQEVVEC